jgi:DNA-binding NtrC family response regulator
MKTILILDDERVLREAFAAYFEDRLWRVVQSESAEEALKLLENESPDVTLVDIRLPGMDGDDFIRKAHLLKPRMAFVICTGSPEYRIPPDLQALPQLSKCVYRKPVTRMADFEKEIVRAIQRLQAAGDE